ncbi:MAG: lipoprotein [Pseudomonadota bacterium]
MKAFRSPVIRLAALAAALSLTLTACGRRGDPRPPAPDQPAVQQPAAQQPAPETPAEEPATSGTGG